MSERPFKILGIQQIAIGGTDKSRMRALWVEKLGLEATEDLPADPGGLTAVPDTFYPEDGSMADGIFRALGLVLTAGAVMLTPPLP